MEDIKKERGKAGGWSKWGGRDFGLLDAMNENPNGKMFYCQKCGAEEKLTWSYAVEKKGMGYIKICSACYFDYMTSEMEDFFNKNIEETWRLFEKLFKS